MLVIFTPNHGQKYYNTSRSTSVVNIGDKYFGNCYFGRYDTYGKEHLKIQGHRHDTCYDSYMWQ